MLSAVIALAALACSSRGEQPRPDSAQGSGASARATSANAAGNAPACPMEGDWTPCAVEERLVRAGVVIEKQPAPTSYPFFTVPGVTYNVGSAEHELLVFLYPSAAARERDTAKLDSATVSPRGTHVAWRTPPTLVVSNNLAAVILSLNDRTVERLALALDAGLPQPEKR